MLIQNYLNLKSTFEPFIFGPGIFWILFIVYFYQYKFSKNLNKKNKKIPIISLFLIIILTSPPLVEIIFFPLYCLTPENTGKKADAIVVLGGGINGSGSPSPTSVERSFVGSKLFLEGRAPLLILSTGFTNGQIDKSEAQAMRIIALGMGVPDNRIILEENSYNTHTNALEVKSLMEKYDLKSIIVITSFSHLYRAYEVFKRIGIAVYPHSAETPKLFRWNIGWWRPIKLMEIFHEYAAIVIYTSKGWI